VDGRDPPVEGGVDLLWTRTRARTAFNPNGNFLYATDLPFEPGDCGDLLASQVPRCPPGDPYCDALSTPVPCPGAPGVDDDGDGLVDEPGRIDSYPFVFQYIDGKPHVTIDDTQLALFVQDSWQVNPRLTLDYGLRYDVASYVLRRRSPSRRASRTAAPRGTPTTSRRAPRSAGWRRRTGRRSSAAGPGSSTTRSRSASRPWRR